MKPHLTDARARNAKPPKTGQIELWDRKAPGLCLRVSYGGRKSFYLLTRFQKRLRRYKLGSYPAMTLAEARRKARDYLAEIEADRDPKKMVQVVDANTVKARVKQFKAEHIRNKRKPLRTATKMERVLDREVVREWGDRQITDITKDDVVRLIEAKAVTAPFAANRLLSQVQAFFTWAVKKSLIAQSPAAGSRGVEKPIDEVKRKRHLKHEEIRGYWNATADLGYPFGPFARLLLLTAQRRGEVAGMRWAEVDLEAKVWRIPDERAKSGDGHEVPLSPAAIEVLEEIGRRGEDTLEELERKSEGTLGALARASEFVFTSNSKTPISGFSKAKKRLAAAIDSAEPWRFHDVRRTVGTNMARLGVPPHVIGKVMNHSDKSITEKHYIFADLEPEKRQALNRWAAELGRIVETQEAGKVVPLHGSAVAPAGA